MKLIDYTLKQKIISEDVEIFQNEKNGNLVLNLYNKYYYEESENFINDYCHFIKEINFKNILIGGLGLGIVPFYLSNQKIYEIDVIEKEEKLIKIINDLNYLKNVTIYHDDVFTYKTDKKYDLILMDVWWYADSNFINEKNNIIENYKNNLTEFGKIYFPIIDEIV